MNNIMTKTELRKSLDFVNEERERLQYDIDNLTYQLAKEKTRIKKAVEYLKSKEDSLFMSFSDDLLDHDELIDKKIGMTLLNILNGEDNE